MDEMKSENSQGSGEAGAGAATASKNTVMGILAYIGPLVIVSYIMAKDDPFVKFHIKQGLVLLVISVAVWIVGSLFWFLWPILQIVNVVVLVFAILGIVNVVQGKEKELPVLGSYAKHFKF